MNFTLCSSTRFLLNDEDFDALSGRMGEKEYLIEAWFADSSQAAAYQTAYEQSSPGLPKNGQAITYTMIFLLSALTDLMTAVVFLMAGVLLIAIALVCLRYAVLAQLESDMREIGTMKAMGIPKRGICGLYLNKIRILTLAGLVIGFPAGLCFLSGVTRHISRTFGSQPLRLQAVLLAGMVSVLVYGIILLFSRKMLSRLGKVTVTELLVTEKGFGRRGKVKDGLRRARRLPLNLLLGLHEVRHGYGIIFGLLLMVSFFVVVPERTAQTMKDDEFVTYMGNPSATREVLDIIGQINRDGTSVLLVTHDAKAAARAERVIYLEDGHVKDILKLGKYQEAERTRREQNMQEWLGKMGF